MRPVLTPREMAAADEGTIAGGTPADVLMERAGGAVARAALRIAGGRYGKTALVFCGPGNNGGDGFVAARRLRAEGVHVRCFFVGDPERAAGAAAHHLDLMRRAGVAAEPFSGGVQGADVVIDALFGTGFRGSAEGEAAKAIDAMNALAAPTVAVDVPSGVAGATGAVAGPAVRATATVVMAAEKVGTACGEGAAHAGAVEVADIGVEVPATRVHVSDASDVRAHLAARSLTAHKGSGGTVAVLAGSEAMTGAALLTARGAYRAGCGYVRLGSSAAVKRASAVALPEVVGRVIAPDGYSADAWEAFAPDIQRSAAVALGPGLGRGEGERDLVLRALAESEIPLVLDADALNNLEGRPGALAEARSPVVITPHPGEMARLAGIAPEEVQRDRLGCARRAAQTFACVVLLKGYRTVIAAPSGDAVIDPAGGPALATAGTGDVLTGVIAALVAAGAPAFEAAWSGAFLHGVAGALAAETRGPDGVVAWDVAEELPGAIARIRSHGTGPG